MKYLKKYQKTIIICFLLILSIIIICIGSSYSLYKIETKGQVHNTIVTGNHSTCQYQDGYVWNFDYTSSEQEFTVPCDGTYQLETWGAQGGSYNTIAIGGYGGYSNGIINLNLNQILYINVGGSGNGNGTHTFQAGGYNGGGNANLDSDSNTRQSSGGGATHIALVSGLLENLGNNINNIVIVSGGGGGAIANAATTQSSGGSAGGYIGYSIDPANITGGSQTSGGIAYRACGAAYDQDGSFGRGGSGVYAGAGSGFYGGAVTCGYATTGGSSYIGNSLLTNKVMYCYNCTESNDILTKTISTTCTSSTPVENCAKQGNGYARITLIEATNGLLPPTLNTSIINAKNATISINDIGVAPKGIKYYEYFITEELIEPTKQTTPTGILTDNINITFNNESYVYVRTVDKRNQKSSWSEKYVIKFICEIEAGKVWNFDYTGGEQTFEVPCSGTYKLETWGAQGGSANIKAGTKYNGGYGSYSTGNIDLMALDNLYIYNGGAGENSYADSNPIQIGGYNGGGGASIRAAASGGGATHIAITSRGELSNYDQYRDEILIVSGGGGGSSADNAGGGYCIGGNAGGFTGPNPTPGATTYYNYRGGSYMYGFGGTQTTGYAFGLGQSGVDIDLDAGAGGGGGFYGGTSGTGTRWTQCSGGGSGYIGNSLLTNKAMYCYKCTQSSEESTKTISTTCTSSTPTVNCAKQGNGYARITYLSN